ncbi:MAG: hypothetical protein DRR16_33630, partial [Candidatus Parabeggiatoa sp. nov. 3]
RMDKMGHFYLDMPKRGKVEMALVSEGFRKIALLVYLIQNGSLNNTLFWDETEANLNPRMRVKVANALAALAQYGIQVILTTHDFFLMKELSLLIESTPKMSARYFSLNPNNAAGVKIEDGRLLEDLNTIIVLDEVLAQDDREQYFYYQRDMQELSQSRK